METNAKQATPVRSYLTAVSTARKLQSDLINLVDEILLANWEDAIECSVLSEEILKALEELSRRPAKALSPSSLNLIETIRKICLLAEYSYRYRSEAPDASSSR